jgi:hypothetical protein
MSNQPHPGEGDRPAGDPHTFSQEVHHSSVSARVPDKVARGVFSTGILVLQWHSEFILDFVLRMNQPHQVVARVVVPISFMPRLIATLRENLDGYRKAFGPPPPVPMPPPPPQPPSIEEIYDNLKVSEEVLSGVYANAAIVSHSAVEFAFDFITNFYPKALVTARVFLSAAHIPLMLNSMTQSWQKYEAKLQQQQQKPPEQ